MQAIQQLQLLHTSFDANQCNLGRYFTSQSLLRGTVGFGRLGVEWTGGGSEPVSEKPASVTFSQSHPEVDLRLVAPMDARYATLWMYTNAGNWATVSHPHDNTALLSY